MLNIPEAMRAERRWIVWAHKDGRKPPVNFDGTPDKNWNSPEQWLDFDEAHQLFEDSPNVDGIGFVLGGGWSGLDMDKCRNVETGELDPRASALLDQIPSAYHEVSPSGEGLKVFGRGDGWLELTFFTGHVRVDRKDKGYFTVTGRGEPGSALEDLPLQLFAEFFGAAEAVETATKKQRVLEKVIRPGTQNNELFKEACGLARKGYDEEELFAALRALADRRCEQEPGREPWSDTDVRAIARSASRYAPTADPFPSTETGDAEFFAKLHAGLIKYDHRQGRWLLYDGYRWKPDKVEEVRQRALNAIRSRQAAAVHEEDATVRKARLDWARKGESSSRLDHALKEARSHPAIASSGEEWDSDPWLLGVPNGVVDLREGILRPARPDDLITLQTAAAFDPEAKCPLWERTLADVFKDQPDLIPYIQRAFGYSLTGDCREEVFFLLIGGGRNGKGTLVNTFAAIIGDYSDNVQFSSLEQQQGGGGATPDIAKLTGKRFVTASEANEGTRINESRIKSITGRDPITARFLYQSEFTFTPEFKLWLSVNHLPRVRDDSDGFWSRPHQIPFNQTYTGREDKELKDKLLQESDGILAWAIRGMLDWRENGLLPPDVTLRAKKDYRMRQEPLSEFYDDECVFHPAAYIHVSDLFAAYHRWLDEKRSRFRLGRRKFVEEVLKRDAVTKRKTEKGAGFDGIGLVNHDSEGEL